MGRHYGQEYGEVGRWDSFFEGVAFFRPTSKAVEMAALSEICSATAKGNENCPSQIQLRIELARNWLN